MLPLIPLALSFVPELVRLIAGDSAGTVANSVAKVVSDVTGTTDPAAAQQKLQQDPSIAANLRIRLAEIALEAQKAQNEENERKRQAQLDELKTTVQNTENARSTMLGLSQAGSWIAWAPVIVSAIVSLGFFAFLIILLLNGLRGVDQVGAQIINIAVGALTAGFATVINFWLGSSQGSRDKEESVRRFQATQADQTREAILSLRSVANTVATTPPPAAAAPAPSPPPAAEAPAAPVVVLPVSDNFERCMSVVFSQEGGFSDDPNDPGGATNMGITLKTLEAWRDRPCTVDDVRNLTKREATEIYRANYWIPMRCTDFPPGVDLMVFDFGVNAGPRTSIKSMQQVLGVTDDGSVGPITLAAVHRANPRDLIPSLAEARLTYYKALPTFATFGKGWTARTEQVESSAEVMSA